MAKEDYLPTIGLEIHAELSTKTKMFCNSKNDPDEKRPNTNVCPICMAHPGTLPVINKEAVKHILRIGTAINSKRANYTEFDRKNYFYPDIPKGYQISQYTYPLVSSGIMNGVTITRVHLEEDTARSTHEGERSLIDFNRAGVPLMELVTDPVIHGAEEAVSFAKELQLLLRTLGVGEANMEKGEMRVEANISVGKQGVLGTKVEVKNLNSFRSVERAIKYEIERHIKTLERGEKILQETRGWDESKEETFSQRLKEDSHDYRYFPDPDLPKLILSEIPEFDEEELLKSIPELPWDRRRRYLSLDLKKEDVETMVQNPTLGVFFDDVISGKEKEFILRAANYIISDVLGILTAEDISGVGKLGAESFRKLIEMSFDGTLSSRGVKDILTFLVKEGGDPLRIAEQKDLIQKSDKGALEEVVLKIINTNPSVVADYRGGKLSSIQYLVGQAMKETKGSGNPGILRGIFEEKLK